MLHSETDICSVQHLLFSKRLLKAFELYTRLISQHNTAHSGWSIVYE